jgi:uncharacterized protein DUF5753
MRAQFAQLLERSERPNISVRVLEKDAGGHLGVEGSFCLLTVDDREVAYADARARDRLILNPSDVQLSVAYDRIGAIAATVGPSRALIERTMESCR